MKEGEDIVNVRAIVSQILAQGRDLEIHLRIGIGPDVSYLVRAGSVMREGYWFGSLQWEDVTLLKAVKALKELCDCQKGERAWGAEGVKP